jgi:tetratricopeptide (TPR) repeat protein
MVYVNEPIGGAFLSGDERVQYEIERAQKRVNEVIKLAIENRLSPEVRDQVVAVLDVHVSRVKEEVNVLAGEGEFKSAIEFTNSLEEVLSVDQAVSFVNEVTDINTDDESLKLELAVIDEVIRGPREASVHAREDAEQKFISSNMPAGAESVAKDIADMKRASLEGLLGRIDPIDSTIQMDQLMTAKMAVPAVATLSASPVSEDTKDKKDIESKTVTPRSEVQALFDLGNEQYSLGNYTQAFIYFKQAFDAAAKLEVKSEEKKEILNLDSEKIEDDSVVSENKSDKNVSTDEKQTNTAEVINAVKKGTVKDVVKTKTQ